MVRPRFTDKYFRNSRQVVVSHYSVIKIHQPNGTPFQVFTECLLLSPKDSLTLCSSRSSPLYATRRIHPHSVTADEQSHETPFKWPPLPQIKTLSLLFDWGLCKISTQPRSLPFHVTFIVSSSSPCFSTQRANFAHYTRLIDTTVY